MKRQPETRTLPAQPHDRTMDARVRVALVFGLHALREDSRPTASDQSGPTIKIEGTSLLSYRAVWRSDLPLIVQRAEPGEKPSNAVTFRVETQDSSSVFMRSRGRNLGGDIVCSATWDAPDPPISLGMPMCLSWLPYREASPGVYTIEVQVLDAQGKTSNWASSDPLLLV